ncbi:MAG: hypothetical protein AB7Q45_22080 [Planctomycetaceae bacterium]
MTPAKYEALRDRFRKVFDSKWSRDELDNFDDLREKFAFHMVEIATNLSRLAVAYESDDCDTTCLANQAEMFFQDCVPHLMAAGQIYDEIPRTFPEQAGVHDWESFVDEEVAS